MKRKAFFFPLGYLVWNPYLRYVLNGNRHKEISFNRIYYEEKFIIRVNNALRI